MVNNFIELYFQNEAVLKGPLQGFPSALREEAIEAFRKSGFPDRKNEQYRYTRIDELFDPAYNMQLSPSNINLNVRDLFTCDVPNLDTHLEIVLNGFYFNQGQELKKHPQGIITGSLAKAMETCPDIVKPYFSRFADHRTDSLVALNTAFAMDGLFIYIPKGTGFDYPLQVVNLPMTGLDTLLQYRNLIIMEEDTHAELIICDHTLSPFRFLTNSVTEIYAGPNARLQYIRVQNEHLNSNLITNLYIHQEAGSQVTTNSITLHGGIIRNNTHVKLNAPGCDNKTYGLFFADKSQHVDNYIRIDHAEHDCSSLQLFKGILDDQATGAFNGHILVRPEGQKTNAYQVSRNILLTDQAKMNTKPQLEIYADDVRCSHGATTGQLDENALFYMRSRGIPLREARLLMLYAFAYEVIDKISVKPLKERIIHLVDKRLRGELSRCNNCSMNCAEINPVK
jgi:Fe-S cluster assembly protein SufD